MIGITENGLDHFTLTLPLPASRKAADDFWFWLIANDLNVKAIEHTIESSIYTLSCGVPQLLKLIKKLGED